LHFVNQVFSFGFQTAIDLNSCRYSF